MFSEVIKALLSCEGMFEKIVNFFSTTVTPIDVFKTRFKRSSGKLKIGFCSIFPPFVNGVAAANYYMLRELLKRKDIELSIIPIKNKFDKRLFSDYTLRFSMLSDSRLDVVVFFGLGHQFEKYWRKVRCKTIAWQTIHGCEKYVQSEKNILKQVRNADRVFALTRWAESWYKLAISQVLYIPHGVDTSLFFPRRNKNSFTCLFVSRMHYYKGFAAFLDALLLVFQKDDAIVARIVAPVDTNSPYLSEIENKMRYLQATYPARLIVNSSWIPYEDIPLQYTNADVLIFTSDNEGFGLPLIEAMSSGIPCICLDRQPMSEIVLDGKTGFCLSSVKDVRKYHGFNFPDPALIAEKIILLKNNSVLKTKLGANARKRVEEEYDLRLVIDKLIDACKKLCKK